MVGSVASGAEIVAGGSVHVYGALQGRAIAGVRETRARASSAGRREPNCSASAASYPPPKTWTPTSGRCVEAGWSKANEMRIPELSHEREEPWARLSS